MTDLEFLLWLHDRLTAVYEENPSVDWMHKLRSIADGVDPTKRSEIKYDVTIEGLRAKADSAKGRTGE